MGGITGLVPPRGALGAKIGGQGSKTGAVGVGAKLLLVSAEVQEGSSR